MKEAVDKNMPSITKKVPGQKKILQIKREILWEDTNKLKISKKVHKTVYYFRVKLPEIQSEIFIISRFLLKIIEQSTYLIFQWEPFQQEKQIEEL